MIKYFDVISGVRLFDDISAADLESMLGCLDAQIADYKKGEAILTAGDKPEHVGVVLAGQLHIVRDDYDGNRTLVAALATGDIFAEALCCAGVAESPVSVLVDADSVIMLMKFSRILNTCPNSCGFHTSLIGNMLGILAGKNLYLQSRMELIGIKSVRGKVLRYLESFIAKQGKNITIQLGRQEMADYLCVDRSALSHELIRMKNDGIIDYHKNGFRLL
jgi:CRP-like cAMP-binding protein